MDAIRADDVADRVTNPWPNHALERNGSAPVCSGRFGFQFVHRFFVAPVHAAVAQLSTLGRMATII